MYKCVILYGHIVPLFAVHNLDGCHLAQYYLLQSDQMIWDPVVGTYKLFSVSLYWTRYCEHQPCMINVKTKCLTIKHFLNWKEDMKAFFYIHIEKEMFKYVDNKEKPPTHKKLGSSW